MAICLQHLRQVDAGLVAELVCCPRCANELTEERRERLRERHKQVMLARKRNDSHIGEQPRRKLTQEKHPKKNA